MESDVWLMENISPGLISLCTSTNGVEDMRGETSVTCQTKIQGPRMGTTRQQVIGSVPNHYQSYSHNELKGNSTETLAEP